MSANGDEHNDPEQPKGFVRQHWLFLIAVLLCGLLAAVAAVAADEPDGSDAFREISGAVVAGCVLALLVAVYEFRLDAKRQESDIERDNQREEREKKREEGREEREKKREMEREEREVERARRDENREIERAKREEGREKERERRETEREVRLSRQRWEEELIDLVLVRLSPIRGSVNSTWAYKATLTLKEQARNGEELSTSGVERGMDGFIELLQGLTHVERLSKFVQRPEIGRLATEYAEWTRGFAAPPDCEDLDGLLTHWIGKVDEDSARWQKLVEAVLTVQADREKLAIGETS